MIRGIVLIAMGVLLVVVHATARADDDPCARNHYILWSGPDHTRSQCVPVVGDDGAAPVAKGVATAVEYYHVEFERYFTTANATEVAALDAGLFPGWHRTGSRYRVRTEASADVAPSGSATSTPCFPACRATMTVGGSSEPGTTSSRRRPSHALRTPRGRAPGAPQRSTAEPRSNAGRREGDELPVPTVGKLPWSGEFGAVAQQSAAHGLRVDAGGSGVARKSCSR